MRSTLPVWLPAGLDIADERIDFRQRGIHCQFETEVSLQFGMNKALSYCTDRATFDPPPDDQRGIRTQRRSDAAKEVEIAG